MFLELTAAHAKSQKLEAAVATLETQVNARAVPSSLARDAASGRPEQ